MPNYKYTDVLIIGDNQEAVAGAAKCAAEYKENIHFEFFSSPDTRIRLGSSWIGQMDIPRAEADIINKFDLIFSVHCRQKFPDELVRSVKCINLHPGLNPYNRGWYPHVFSIINKLPAGVTIHEMDETFDHGDIIAQKKLDIFPHETSGEVYQRLLALESELFSDNLQSILQGNYQARKPREGGSLNTKKDFESIKEIDLNKMYKAGEFIDLLRALSHGPYKNAFFYTEKGYKVYLKLVLEKEQDLTL